MYWPTEPRTVSLEELGWVNTSYLATATSRCDTTIVWGTTIQTEALSRFVTEQRQQTGTLVSTAHVLIRAVVEALHRHPNLNRRVIGRRVYPYDGVHITMPMLETRSGEVNLVYLRHAERMPLVEISRMVWEKARDVALQAASDSHHQRDDDSKTRWRRKWAKWIRVNWVYRMSWFGFFVTNRFRLPTFTIDEVNGSSAFVNHLGFPGSPPMISYKPSYLPTNSFGVSVTLGAAEMRPVVEDQAVVIRSVAPVFVRVDHRLVNGYQTAAFVSTLRNALQNPDSLISSADSEKSHAA